MMGPHWNPKATEIAIVTYGSGIVQTVCPSTPSSTGGESGHHEGGRGGDEGWRDHHEEGGTECKNSVFRVSEGDVFVVPRFHPMAQMSFNNGSFVFVGFSTHMGQNHPQFLAGKPSVLQVIGKEILALSLGQKNSTAVEKLLSAQRGSTIMACISCAEELERKAEQEEQEGGKGKGGGDEEERRRKEEEEEEEERRQREEEERARREEKERRQREEEERARREEKERKQREEEEQRRREQEEEERRRREEEEGGGGQGGGGDEPPREEEEERRRREEEEGGRGGGDESPEEEEGDWGGDSAKNLKKRYRARKGAVFRSF
jgi:hypothetical protein